MTLRNHKIARSDIFISKFVEDLKVISDVYVTLVCDVNHAWSCICQLYSNQLLIANDMHHSNK